MAVRAIRRQRTHVRGTGWQGFGMLPCCLRCGVCVRMRMQRGMNTRPGRAHQAPEREQQEPEAMEEIRRHRGQA